MINKYTEAMRRLLSADAFDYVVDNNPSTFACCGRHLVDYFRSVHALLRPGGTWLTDKEGLGHTPRSAPEGRQLSLADLTRIADGLAFRCEAVTQTVYALTKLAA